MKNMTADISRVIWESWGNVLFSVLCSTFDKFVLFSIIRALTGCLMASNLNTSGYQLVFNFRSSYFSYYLVPCSAWFYRRFFVHFWEETIKLQAHDSTFELICKERICNYSLWRLYSCWTHMDLSACCDDVIRHATAQICCKFAQMNSFPFA